jgi:hypothetical protein
MTRTFLWVLGGALCATGVLSALFAFEVPFGGDIATSLDRVGFDAVADVTTNGFFPLTLLGLGLGIPLLVSLNAGAWKQTGGY